MKKIEFTNEQLTEIENQYKAGATLSALAKEFSCSRDVITRILVERKISLRKAAVEKKCIICAVILNSSNTTWYRQKNYIHKCNECIRHEKAIDAENRRRINPSGAADRSEQFRQRLKTLNPRRYTAQQMRGSAKKRATALGVPYDLDSQYLESIMPDKCPILDIEIKYGGGEKTKQSASLDRVVPKRGYTKGNVMVVSQLANLMKNEATPEEMLTFAKWVVRNIPEK